MLNRRERIQTGRIALIAAALVGLSGLEAQAQAGETPLADSAQPTPYPTRAQDWPGRGVIRVFEWMDDNRRHFWRERDQHQNSVVFAGDSLVALWKSLPETFPTLRIANRGIGGDVSRGLLFRFREDVLALNPKAVVILIGTNDLTARQPAADTIANVDAMLKLRDAYRPDVPIVLCTVPPSANAKAPVDAAQRARLNEGLHRLAATRPRVAVADLFAVTATTNGNPIAAAFKPDRLHLTREGYARWKAVLVPILREGGVLSSRHGARTNEGERDAHL